MRDADVVRGVLETIRCLALPQEVFVRPGFMEKVQSYAGEEPDAFPGPDRAGLLEHLG